MPFQSKSQMRYMFANMPQMAKRWAKETPDIKSLPLKKSSMAAGHMTSPRKKPKLGTGARFKALKGKLAAKGAKNPGALAAFIGRKKYGAHKMAAMAAHGRKK